MGAIMIDNWSIQSFIVNLKYGSIYDPLYYYDSSYADEYKSIEQGWINFLTAIMLWDEVWFYQHHLSDFWQREMDEAIESNEEYHEPLLKIKDLIKAVNVEDNAINDTVKHYLTCPDSKIEASIEERSMFYYFLSNLLGINYLPHPSRSNDLDDYKDYLFSREELIRQIDKELYEYYSYINKELGREYLKFNYPVIYDLIRFNSMDLCDQIYTTLSIREDDDVITFRDEVYEIEQVINRGNTQSLLTQLNVVSKIAKDITNKYNKKTKVGELSLAIAPSLSVPINIKRNSNMKIHTAFIKKLINFGIYERTQK